ncbi:hypothetical protein N7481_003779 [Penicillium waksmanii]|uniref:uncharacterized protein n=1 Tax=Penicillium waksmanii TaxID=69791 RepID=UPI002547B45C|nr:uncharacterized protein N7481_003779 [Penicillium waksmanii]KAJ5988569.1 hypothetical protein N7481_003779 [Penicillium waksmanii]
MRFSIATALTLAAGAFAGVVTETVTDYTTFCPEATSIVHGGSTYSVSTPGSVTLTALPPLSPPPPLPPPAPRPPSRPPYVPSGADATGVPAASGSGSTPAPSQPAFNAGAMNAAGAGAGLAAVLGAAVLLL